jgi:hypothetical protein
MRDVVLRTVRVKMPTAGRHAAVMEVQVMGPAPARRWRRVLALWLMRLAGRLAKMRVRVVAHEDDVR